MLTQRQHQLLKFIQDYLDHHGVPPSFEEMRSALKLKSKSGIHRLITGLEERGYIRRLAYRARALEVLRLPTSLQKVAGGDVVDSSPDEIGAGNVVHGRFGLRPSEPANGDGHYVSLPLYGRIAAGTPIGALRDHSTQVEVPVHMVQSGDHYALEVVGDSMIEAGIRDGDIVVIQRTETAENGEIVVALVDEEEVTLKRLRRKGATVALEPANPQYETRIFGPSRVKVQGRLVSLMRTYH
ncbi:MAG: transcriptional repressor LexA [Alphaproteobacteria bacterium]|nr:transcriptional repressor LexA [Alphaproteobacteria bacterium]